MTDSLPPLDPVHVVARVELPAQTIASIQASPFGPFVVHLRPSHGQEPAPGLEDGSALIIGADPAGHAQAAVTSAGPGTAVLVVTADLDPATVLDWLQRGAQDVLLRDELAAPSLPMRLRAAVERKRLERAARTAYATDLETGLPHQQQLIEHMSQLLALRERDPSPMAVLALRIEGIAAAQARLGRVAANVLRRKVGVRLRASVRASDVVASLGGDHFAVLLGSMLAPPDAMRVGIKLVSALLQPFQVAGNDVTVAVAIGIGQYPQDGSQPDALLRRAVGLAAAAQAQGHAGFLNVIDTGGAMPGAANDD